MGMTSILSCINPSTKVVSKTKDKINSTPTMNTGIHIQIRDSTIIEEVVVDLTSKEATIIKEGEDSTV